MAYNKDGPVVVIDNYDSFTYNLCQVDTLCPSRTGSVTTPCAITCARLQTNCCGTPEIVNSTSAHWAATTWCTRTMRSRWRRFASEFYGPCTRQGWW